MTAQNAEWIAIGVVCLNPLTAQGVRIIACPELGHIAEHSKICTVSAGSAAFKENVGKAYSQAFQQVVKSQKETMSGLSLLFSRQEGAVIVTDSTIHIPFHIVYAAGKHLA